MGTEYDVNKVATFSPSITPLKWKGLKFVLTHAERFNLTQEKFSVDIIPAYSNEDYPYWVANLFFRTTNKLTNREAHFKQLHFSYIEHIMSLDDTDALYILFATGEQVYETESLNYSKDGCTTIYSNERKEGWKK